ncbi:MAG: cyclic nucleotide-binding domain-containing protein [Chitinivibrionales bacterium]|nr:cyclic nucleotide-binding domain-containing protein [Chitinivibrionales bacterium]
MAKIPARKESSSVAYAILENVVFLKKTPLFSSIRTHDIGAVASIAEEITFRPGEEIVSENDVGDSLFLIKKGTVRIVKKVDETSSIDLAELSIGECFGDMAVFDAEQRSASVRAKDTCTLLRINGQDLIDVILDHPHISIELLKIFIKRLRKANATIRELSSKSSFAGKPEGAR